MSIKTIVVTGMLFLAGTIVSGQTSTNQVKEKNMEKLELVKEWDKVYDCASVGSVSFISKGTPVSINH